MAGQNVATSVFEELFTSKKKDLLENFGHMDVSVEKYDLYFSQLKEICQKISDTECQQISAKSGAEVLACVKELFTIADFSNSLRPNLRKKLREKFYSLEPPLDPPAAADGTNGSLPVVTSPTNVAAPEVQKTADPNVPDEHINNTISLILHILLTISVKRVKRFALGGETAWNDTDTLRTFIDSQFPAPKEADSKESERKVTMDRTFTAANLWNKREIKVVPNYDLRDHLSYARTKRTKWMGGSKGTIQVYPLRRWLDLHQLSKKGLLPDKLVKETLHSLALLFPFDESIANDEYLKFIEFKEIIGCDYPFEALENPLSLEDFDIWQDRLATIYDVFTGPPISGWQKFREDKQGWFSFWGAVVCIVFMTFIFGVLAITFAILAWSKAHADADELLDVVKELLEVVKKAAEPSDVVAEKAPTVTVTVTAMRF